MPEQIHKNSDTLSDFWTVSEEHGNAYGYITMPEGNLSTPLFKRCRALPSFVNVSSPDPWAAVYKSTSTHLFWLHHGDIKG